MNGVLGHFCAHLDSKESQFKMFSIQPLKLVYVYKCYLFGYYID